MAENNKLWHRFELKRRSKGLKKQARKAEGATVRHARRFVVNRWDNIREVRLHITMWLAGVGLLIAIVGLQMLWYQGSYSTVAPVQGGTYAEAVQGPIETLNPLYAVSPAELSASQLLFSSLYANDSTGHLKGDVAMSMKNENDKVFTVKLRKDARWHNGQQLTAKDVVFTVGLMKNPAVRSVMNASWRGIDAKQLDDYTVQFTLPASYAAFPQALTFAILPEHLLKVIEPSNLRESGFSDAPIGSGPFSLRLLQTVSETTGRKIVHLAANDDYFNGRPKLDRLQLHSYSDDDAIARALRTGEVNAASDVNTDVARAVDKNRYDTLIKPVNSGVYVIFNSSQPALKDSVVRRALQVGTDTQAIRSKLFGDPKQLDLPFVQGQIEGTEGLTRPAYDREAAEKLLNDGGWVKQDGVRTKGADKLQLRIVTRKNSDYEKALSVLASQWRQLGVDVESQVVDTSDRTQNFTQDILQRRNYDVLLDELVIGGDPDVFAYWHSRGILNFSNYSNQLSDDALASARNRSDPVLRAVKYTAFAKQWLADVPAIGLYQSNLIYVRNKASRSIQPDEKITGSNEHYSNVRYWTAEQGTVRTTP